ncbi:anti-sigma factor [Sediminibacterium sp. TEGAF015]|uniref:hypothetical protein n=1 Tax=Sediminibacterium sp. TEGAF015 TaxID=575378 RepID=UPI00220D43F0|nr:hypothetical protein [Sediminibacterium sp. TEGAF015]BDQ12452.1 hypothetical protein TEGAF0_16690 [Sediminibacterium sp. TEGAF015]
MTVINRHNYESYFLLWVDGELSDEEQVAVDRFVAENPDLAEELSLLKSTQLQPEEAIVFKGKEALFKKEGQDISLNNYEEWFLLYTDKELSEEQRRQVEVFVLQHPALQYDFEWLQQTRLPEEKWVFANKELLYRKSSGTRPVVYMRWMRYAAAAAVIGIMATVWMLVPANTLKEPLQLEGSTPEIVGNSGNSTDQTQNSSIQPKANSVAAENLPNVKVIGGNQLSNQGSNSKSNGQLTASGIVNNNPVIKMVETVPVQNPGDVISANSSIVPKQNLSLASINSERVVPVIVAAEKPLHSEMPEEKADAVPEESKPVYTALEDVDEDKSLYIGALEINKDRLRGLFRKAGSIFRSKSKQNEEDGRQRK